MAYQSPRLFFTFLLCSLAHSSCTKEDQHPILKFSQNLMGTDVHILVNAKEGKDLDNAIDATFLEGNRLNMIFSDYEAKSEVSRFSKTSGTGKPFKLSPELFDVLSYSQGLSRKTSGAFDVTVGPLSRLWRMARFQKKLPHKQKLSNAISRMGYANLTLNKLERSGSLKLEGMVLDLGGIAKGYIADRMLEKMKSFGFSRCLIDAGGDLTLGEAPQNRKGWRIEIGGRKHPELPILELSNCAVATSGDLEQFLQIEEKFYSHIIDPFTGFGLLGRAQVTVVSQNGMLADSLASACLALGFEKASNLSRQSEIDSFYYLQKADSGTTLKALTNKK
jgi:thiamine biosynthesis lipoprotein